MANLRRLPPGSAKGRVGEAGVHKLGYQRTPGSGNGAIKGDARTTEEMIEVKTTSADSYRIDTNDLRKLEREAAAAARRPVMIVVFEGRRRYAVLPLDDYRELTGADQD